MFVDIHNHVLNGIDDGSDSLITSIEMLKIARAEGIGKIITTPHFIFGAVNNTSDNIKRVLERFKELIKIQDIKIDLLPGSEVFICPETSYLVEDNTICRLNDSKYILIEFPMFSIPNYVEDILFRLQLQGYKPIIAHPERNKVFQQYPEELYKFVERGMLTQVNSSSINKVYGRAVEKIALGFIEKNLVHFIATDAHTCRGRAPKMRKSYERVIGVVGKEIADNLFINNGTAVIENRDFKIPAPIKQRNKGFNFMLNVFKNKVSL